MSELGICYVQQGRAADYLLSDGPDHRGASLGLSDWVAEECLIREERLSYEKFLASKSSIAEESGFTAGDLNPMLFDFQAAIVRWALRRGKAAVFADCGLGKTPMQLEWAHRVVEHTARPVIIFAPLAVSNQTVDEGEKFGIPVKIVRDESEIGEGIHITNYEKIAHFPDPSRYAGIVLDESSILKHATSKTRNLMTEWAKRIPYRLCCTATPAPNDYTELGNHAEFLGVMTQVEMFSMFFVHDGGDTSKWRLKGHAEEKFWKWICSWAVAIRKPSDLGFPDAKFILPPLTIEQITVPATEAQEGLLFPVEAQSLQERQQVRKETIPERVKACADLIEKSKEPWLIWCNLNPESEALTEAIVGAVEVKGADKDSHKEWALHGFANGELDRLVSKPSIAGFGLNFQRCSKMAFVGLSDSYEEFYQAVRRCWRFGQRNPVTAYVITSELEGAVVRNIERKEKQAMEMMDGMVQHMKTEMNKNVRGLMDEKSEYRTAVSESENWKAELGDSCELIRNIPTNSIHYSIYSPPFASLYTYSNSDRDMGNCKDYNAFAEHMNYLARELYRVLMPGRLMSFHCMNLPLTKERDGVIGIRDFRGKLIDMFESVGFVFHSEVCIWKDPVTAMQRTKAIGLLYKQLRKDSCISRQGIPDYLVTMRKDGINPERVTKTHEGFPVELWQNYASPVWMDINPSGTLQKDSQRNEDDERHICPLQLEVIRRGIKLWTNPGDVVFSPFMGIGSEGHVAIEQGRRFHGIELKPEYYEQAVANLRHAETFANSQLSLQMCGSSS